MPEKFSETSLAKLMSKALSPTPLPLALPSSLNPKSLAFDLSMKLLLAPLSRMNHKGYELLTRTCKKTKLPEISTEKLWITAPEESPETSDLLCCAVAQAGQDDDGKEQ